MHHDFEKLFPGHFMRGTTVFVAEGMFARMVAYMGDDGAYVFVDTPPVELANTSANEVKSRKKREPKAAPPVAEPDALDLDDI